MALSIQLEIQKQLNAVKAYSGVVEEATRCAELYREAQLPVPPKLRTFLGLDGTGRAQHVDSPAHMVPTRAWGGDQHTANPDGRTGHVRINDPKLNRAQRVPAKPYHGEPPQGTEGWVSLVARHASPQALTLAVLRRAGRIKMADLNRAVAFLRGLDGSSSAAYNVVIRLRETGEAVETPEGWALTQPMKAGLVEDGILWSPKELLTDADNASVRREAILLLLKENGPLIIGAITRGLSKCEWLPVPTGRYFVKADIRQLEKEGYVRPLPSGEWQLTDKTWEE